MGRHELGIAAAVAALLALAWMWPAGGEPPDGAPTATEPTASASPSPPGADEDEVSGTGAPEAPVSSAEPSVSASVASPSEAPHTRGGPAPNTYDGPLGTRNHTGDDTVALTFDDGPSPKWTPRVLGMLREQGVKATFCLIGAYAEAYPELVADIAREGHTLCNHSWFHEFDLGKRGNEEIRANLRRTNDAIVKAAPGAEVRYFRHPGGQWTDRAIAVAADLGMESLHWAVDPSDWDKSRSEAEIRDNVLDQSEPGAIVLLHDGGANQRDMYGALRSILAEFTRRGYTYTGL
jgi:peptidoglycan/xylan/chitin deacetylase (PgdA/CDA1 family)